MPGRRPSPTAVAALARDLSALRVTCGSPSYAQLYKKAALLPPSTVSGVLNARTAPKLAFVLAFVRAVLAHADAYDVEVPPADRDLLEWKRRWERLYAASGADSELESATAPITAASDGPRSTVPWQMPPAPRILIGREAEVARLDGHLQQAQAAGRPLTLLLHGPRGVGKTALALTWARQHRDDWPDGQLHADFSTGRGQRALTTAEVLIDFLTALGHRPGDLPANESGLAGMFRSALTERTMLVVLESAERASDVRPLLPGEGKSAVVVTARDRIRSLLVQDHAAAEPVLPLSAESAVDLLMSDAPQLEQDQGELIARACGYLPLPLRIAADTLQHGQDPAALIDLFAKLDSAEGAGPDRHALDPIMSWSLRTQSPVETATFATLSVLPGRTFDIHEAAALLDLPSPRAADHVSRLASTNLVSSVGDRRYELHPLVREWVGRVATSELSADSRRHARRRLFGYYLWTADAADRIILPQRQRPALVTSLPKPASGPRLTTAAAASAWAADNLANLTAAVVQAEKSDDAFAYLLPDALMSYFNLAKPWPQWQLMVQTGLVAARHHGRSEEVGHLESSLGVVLRETQRPAEAAAAFRRAFDSYGTVGNTAGQAMALNNLATVYNQMDQRQKAIDALTYALSILDRTEEPFRVAIVLHNLAEAELHTGQVDKALEHITRARDIALEIDDRGGAALSMATMGDVLDRLGRWKQAAAEYRNALEILAETGDQFGQVNAHRQLGKLLIRHGQTQKGAGHLDRATAIEESLRSAR